MVSGESVEGFGTWSIDRIQSFLDGECGGQNLMAVRMLAISHAQEHSDVALPQRLRWAKISLQASRRMGGSEWRRDASNEFMLRTWVIDRHGPIADDADWDPDALAADTLAELSLDPAEVRGLAVGWPGLPIERIRELRRHKTLTGHVDTLIDHVRPGPVREQLGRWLEVRRELP